MQETMESVQGQDDGSLVSVPAMTPSSLHDEYDEYDATISDHDSTTTEGEGEKGYPSRQKETHVLPDSVEQARSLAASLADLEHTLQEERRGLLYVKNVHFGIYKFAYNTL